MSTIFICVSTAIQIPEFLVVQGYKRTQKRVGFTGAPHVTYRRHDEYRRERERKRGTTGNAGCRNWRSCDLYAPLPIAQRVANDSPCGYEWRTDNNGKGGILKQLIQRIIKGKNSLKGNMTKLRAPPLRKVCSTGGGDPGWFSSWWHQFRGRGGGGGSSQVNKSMHN